MQLMETTSQATRTLESLKKASTGQLEIVQEAKNLLSYLEALRIKMETSTLLQANPAKLQLLCSENGPFEQCEDLVQTIARKSAKRGQRIRQAFCLTVDQMPIEDALAAIKRVMTLIGQTLRVAFP